MDVLSTISNMISKFNLIYNMLFKFILSIKYKIAEINTNNLIMLILESSAFENFINRNGSEKNRNLYSL